MHILLLPTYLPTCLPANACIYISISPCHWQCQGPIIAQLSSPQTLPRTPPPVAAGEGGTGRLLLPADPAGLGRPLRGRRSAAAAAAGEGGTNRLLPPADYGACRQTPMRIRRLCGPGPPAPRRHSAAAAAAGEGENGSLPPPADHGVCRQTPMHSQALGLRAWAARSAGGTLPLPLPAGDAGAYRSPPPADPPPHPSPPPPPNLTVSKIPRRMGRPPAAALAINTFKAVTARFPALDW